MARGKYERRRLNKTRRELFGGLSKPLADSELQTRATNLLTGAGIATLAEAAVKSDEELLEIKGFGKSYLEQLHQCLDAQEDYARIVKAGLAGKRMEIKTENE